MTSTTAAPKQTKKERKMLERDRRERTINERLGLTDRDQRRQHDRYSYGTGGGRQRPRAHGGFSEGFRKMEPEAESLFIRLIEAINPEAGRESDYPTDATKPARYAVGQQLQIHMIGQAWNVEVVTVAVMFNRWRVKVNFLDTDASFAVTQAQLAKLEVLPVTLRDHRPLVEKYGLSAPPAVTTAPTHLLPAPKAAEYRYAGQVWTGDAAERVQARLTGHSIRQGWKYWMPLGHFTPPVLYV